MSEIVVFSQDFNIQFTAQWLADSSFIIVLIVIADE